MQTNCVLAPFVGPLGRYKVAPACLANWPNAYTGLHASATQETVARNLPFPPPDGLEPRTILRMSEKVLRCTGRLMGRLLDVAVIFGLLAFVLVSLVPPRLSNVCFVDFIIVGVSVVAYIGI